MRIIAGKYKGLRLTTPSGDKTHPMGERIRGAIFNSLGTKMVDTTVLDAFAGTGALGLEALSRGARKVVLIENDKRANRAIRENVDRLDLDGQNMVELFPVSVATFIATNSALKFDFIFADPPYNKLPLEILRQLSSLLTNSGILVLSLPKGTEVLNLPHVAIYKTATYADACILYYTKLSSAGVFSKSML